jgi:hypothetical protein
LDLHCRAGLSPHELSCCASARNVKVPRIEKKKKKEKTVRFIVLVPRNGAIRSAIGMRNQVAAFTAPQSPTPWISADIESHMITYFHFGNQMIKI